jgi:hypothetical protein
MNTITQLYVFCDTTVKMYFGPGNIGKFTLKNLPPEMSAITNKCKLLGLGPKYG